MQQSLYKYWLLPIDVRVTDSLTNGRRGVGPYIELRCVVSSNVIPRTPRPQWIQARPTDLSDVENGRCLLSLEDAVDVDLGSVEGLNPRPPAVWQRASDVNEQHVAGSLNQLDPAQRTPSGWH